MWILHYSAHSLANWADGYVCGHKFDRSNHGNIICKFMLLVLVHFENAPYLWSMIPSMRPFRKKARVRGLKFGHSLNPEWGFANLFENSGRSSSHSNQRNRRKSVKQGVQCSAKWIGKSTVSVKSTRSYLPCHEYQSQSSSPNNRHFRGRVVKLN